MTAKELAEILMKHPDNEMFFINYEANEEDGLIPIYEVYNEEEGKTVLSME